jgi:hypothetical protein
MAEECPIDCECRRTPIGVFDLTLCLWSAIFSPTLLGGNLGEMLGDLLGEPHTLAPALAGWVIFFVVGLFLTLSGISPALREDDTTQSWALSLAAVGGGTMALALGWHLPGAFLSCLSTGLEVSTLVAGAANIGLSLAARGYRAGYVAATLGTPGTAPARFDTARLQQVIHEQSTAIATLTAERNRLTQIAEAGSPARDLEEVLDYPGVLDTVRKAALKELHRDTHVGVSEAEARAYDQRFQRASAVFERLARR